MSSIESSELYEMLMCKDLNVLVELLPHLVIDRFAQLRWYDIRRRRGWGRSRLKYVDAVWEVDYPNVSHAEGLSLQHAVVRTLCQLATSVIYYHRLYDPSRDVKYGDNSIDGLSGAYRIIDNCSGKTIDSETFRKSLEGL